jgi:hypothetical protein
MVSEPGSGLVLYGGRIDSTHVSNQTWEWTGTTWLQQSPSVNPGDLVALGGTFDATTQNVVLYGGSNGTSGSGATWLGGVTPAFTSSPSVSFQSGVNASFTVSTSGSPSASITNPDALPNGLTFTANSDGTATITGTPVAGTAAGTYSLDLSATNDIGQGTQTLALTVTPAAQQVSLGAVPASGVIVGQTFSPTATSSSGAPVTLTVDPASASNCSMNPTTGVVSALAAGTCQIDAVQSGSSQYLAASASETVAVHSATPPTITAQLSSGKPSRAGWYRTPVTVIFTCNAGSSSLATACPASVKLTSSGRHTVTGAITTSSGVVANVAVAVKIDSTAPTIVFAGAKRGRGAYRREPKIRCSAHDGLSGVASCELTKHMRKTRTGDVIIYTATATDRAGNVTVRRLTVTVRR